MPFPLDVRFVREVEAKLGRSLPLGYVARICRDNGGTVAVERNTFHLHPILDATDRKRLARSCNDVLRETAVARKYQPNVFPTGALAIGDNGGGDLLVLLPDADGRRFADAVYRWRSEPGELDLVADTFEELA